MSVESAPDDIEKWKGISGCPIFLTETQELAGIIQKVPENFSSRLTGIPALELFEDPSFVSSLEDSYYEISPNTALLLKSEKDDMETLLLNVKSALKSLEKDFNLKVYSIVDVLSDRKSFLSFLKLICQVNLLFIDATDYQPGIMMIMGIRAVVKRGITLVLTTNLLNESLTNLPFNIQQIKQLSINPASYDFSWSVSIKDRIAHAITEGAEQLTRSPEYLDQPAYQAVRNPAAFDHPEIRDRCLVLCSYNLDYVKNNYRSVQTNISIEVSPTSNIVRMLDITSPQLVSQSLYEHIRWAEQCVVDWTLWQPNVFYELGVRLAATDDDPAIILDEKNLPKSGDLVQKRLLLQLFDPFLYSVSKNKFPEAFR